MLSFQDRIIENYETENYTLLYYERRNEIR